MSDHIEGPIVDISARDRFRLSPSFLKKYENEPVLWGPVGEITYRRTYARPEDRGLWWMTCKRVVEGIYTYQKWHCRKLGLPWSDSKAQRSAQIMFDLIFTMKFLPPGRGLWMCGTEYVEKYGGAALNNCGFVSTAHIAQDFSDPFIFLMDMSMLGVGVGGDTKGAGKIGIRKPKQETDTHVVGDSRQGWLDIAGRVLNAYSGKGSLPGHIDVSGVRRAGTLIKGFGGIAAGPEPLLKLIERLNQVLSSYIDSPVTSQLIVDIFNMIGVCVVSGNVRRSAEILLGHKDDQAFAYLKDPQLFPRELLEWRWASNNSILSEIGMDYEPPANRTSRNGEPGYQWMETARNYGRLVDPPNYADADAEGTNPCAEQTLCHKELCCLVETFPSRVKDYAEYEKTLKYAYLYAKTVTLLPTHNAATNAVVMKNRRIGTSQSGIVDNFARVGRQAHLKWCDDGYRFLRKLDNQYADWLCVPRSRKITSVKPSGTVSLLPGVSPGIHYPHSEYYYRTIRIAKTNELLEALRKANYRIEDDVCDSSSAVVYFPIHEKHFDRAKSDVTIWEQASNAAALQKYWADNQVSITISFKPEEGKDIRRVLEVYEDQLKSVSFLPLDEHSYAQAPYQTITRKEYEAAVSSLLPVNYGATEHDVTDAYCDSDRCTPLARASSDE